MIAGSLFSGVGGLDLGLTRAGYEHAFFAEVDPWRRDVLRAHYPGTTIHGDVRDVHRERLERGGGLAAADPEGSGPAEHAAIDLLAGGFPCQDLSVAGKRAGLAGNRSGLFFEFARIIQTIRPRWVLLENVPGLLSSNDGRDMGVVVGTLADLGYGWAYRVLDARYFGVPQRRRRVFIVCHLGTDNESALRALCEGCDRHLAASQCSWQGTASDPGGRPAFALRKNPGGVGQGHDTNYVTASTPQSHKTGGYRIDAEAASGNHLVVAPALAQTLTRGHAASPGVNAPGRRQEDDVNLVTTAFHQTQEPITEEEMSPAIGRTSIGMGIQSQNVGVRRLTPIECERLMSWPDGWTAPEGVKAPDSRRYAACGDGVVSNVSEWIGRRILAIDAEAAA